MLVGALVVESDLADVGQNDPVTGKVDGVLVSLIDSGHAPAAVGAIQWVGCPFAFNNSGELPFRGREVADSGVGILSFDFDMLLARKGVAAVIPGWPLIPQQSDE